MGLAGGRDQAGRRLGQKTRRRQRKDRVSRPILETSNDRANALAVTSKGTEGKERKKERRRKEKEGNEGKNPTKWVHFNPEGLRTDTSRTTAK